MSYFVGKQICMTFEMISPNGAATLNNIYNANGNPRYLIQSATLDSNALTTEWKKIKATFTVSDMGSSRSEAPSNKIEVYVPSKKGCKIRKVKVEIATQPTDWTPAPEDTENKLAEPVTGTQTGNTRFWTGNAPFSELKDGQQILYWLPRNTEYTDAGARVTGVDMRVNSSTTKAAGTQISTFESGTSTNAVWLNLTMATGTETGWVPCYYGSTSRLTSHYSYGNNIHLTYKVNANVAGVSYTGWFADANYNSDSYYLTRFYNAVKAAEAIPAGRMIAGTSSGYKVITSGMTFDISYPILWANSAISSGSTNDNTYLYINSKALTNNKSGVSLTAYKTAYIKGVLNGKFFTVDDAVFANEPTSRDGKQYIPVGYLYNATSIYFEGGMPKVYEYGQNGFDVAQKTFIYIRYSTKSNGNPMTVTPSQEQGSETQYVGISFTTSPTPPTSYNGYTWYPLTGTTGIQNTQGIAVGTGYLHIKWSADAQTFSPSATEGGIPAGKKPANYYGIYVDTNQTDSGTFADYDWVDSSVVKDELNKLQQGINDVDAKTQGVKDDLNNNYYDKGQIDSKTGDLQGQLNGYVDRLTQVEQLKDSFNIRVSDVIRTYNGEINSITTTTGYTFNKDGLTISKTGKDISNLITEDGVFVKRNAGQSNEEMMMQVNSTGGEMNNLKVHKYFEMGKNSRMEDYNTNRTGMFYIGG